jgi:hypothetical protein
VDRSALSYIMSSGARAREPDADDSEAEAEAEAEAGIRRCSTAFANQ